MKTIIVSEANRARIEEALAEGQGKARTRVIDADDVFKGVEDASRRLFDGLRLTRKGAAGVVVVIQPEDRSFPGAYTRKGTPMNTFIRLEFTGRAWKLLSVSRMEAGGDYGYIQFTEAALAEMAVRCQRFGRGGH